MTQMFQELLCPLVLEIFFYFSQTYWKRKILQFSNSRYYHP